MVKHVVCLGLMISAPLWGQSDSHLSTRSAVEAYFPDFEIHQTKHWWILLDQKDPKFAADLEAVLEREYDCFWEAFTSIGMDLRRPKSRMTFVFCRSLEIYQQLMTKATGERSGRQREMARVPGGWFNEYRNFVLKRDVSGDRAVARGGMDPHLENLRGAAHEGAHQLAFNFGVQKWGSKNYPKWLGEGLAENFAFEDPEQDFGPQTNNLSPRSIAAIERRGNLTPLDDFLATEMQQMTQEMKSMQYVQGWALFRFLFREHPQKLKRYFQTLEEAGTGGRRKSGSALRAEFESCFGPVGGLTADWNRFLSGLQSNDQDSALDRALEDQ